MPERTDVPPGTIVAYTTNGGHDISSSHYVILSGSRAMSIEVVSTGRYRFDGEIYLRPTAAPIFTTPNRYVVVGRACPARLRKLEAR